MSDEVEDLSGFDHWRDTFGEELWPKPPHGRTSVKLYKLAELLKTIKGFGGLLDTKCAPRLANKVLGLFDGSVEATKDNQPQNHHRDAEPTSRPIILPWILMCWT